MTPADVRHICLVKICKIDFGLRKSSLSTFLAIIRSSSLCNAHAYFKNRALTLDRETFSTKWKSALSNTNSAHFANKKWSFLCYIDQLAYTLQQQCNDQSDTACSLYK